MEPKILLTIMIQTSLILISVLLLTKITVRARKTPAYWSYLVIQLGLLIWLLGVFMGTVAPSEELADFYLRVDLTGLLVLPFGWLLFCQSFTKGQFPSKTQCYGIGLTKGLVIVLLFTNSFHSLMVQGITGGKLVFGVLFWPVVGLLSWEFFLGLGVLLRRKTYQVRKKGTYCLAFSGLSAYGGALTYLDANYSYPLYLLALIPLSLFLAFIQYTWKDNFVDVSAGAFDVFMNSIRETILIFDEQGKLIEFSSLSLASELSIEGISTFEDFLNHLSGHLVSGNLDMLKLARGIADEKVIQEEIGLQIADQETCCTISITNLNKKGDTLGTVITLRDITREKELERDLKQKNIELEDINNKLYDYIEIEHQLEVEKERNQITMDINGLIGNNISDILTDLEGLHQSFANDKLPGKHHLEAVIGRCRLVLQRIRVVVAKLMPAKADLLDSPERNSD